MGRVSVSKEMTISLEKEEMDVLEKAYEITKELTHDLFMADDESDEYFIADETKDGLKQILGFAGRFVK